MDKEMAECHVTWASFLASLGAIPDWAGKMLAQDGRAGQAPTLEYQARVLRILTEHHGSRIVDVLSSAVLHRAVAYESAIRKHRDQRGDDRCWMDDEELYKVLPEGFTPPPRDTTVELKNCERYIASRQAPQSVYVSPQREIERLQGISAVLRSTVADAFAADTERAKAVADLRAERESHLAHIATLEAAIAVERTRSASLLMDREPWPGCGHRPGFAPADEDSECPLCEEMVRACAAAIAGQRKEFEQLASDFAAVRDRENRLDVLAGNMLRRLTAWEPIIRAALRFDGVYTEPRDVLWAACEALVKEHRP